MIPCQLYSAVGTILLLYILVMLVYALVSWVPSIRGQWSDIIARLVEPVLQPLRRVIPPIAGLDLSFLIVIFVLQALRSWFISQPCAL